MWSHSYLRYKKPVTTSICLWPKSEDILFTSRTAYLLMKYHVTTVRCLTSTVQLSSPNEYLHMATNALFTAIQDLPPRSKCFTTTYGVLNQVSNMFHNKYSTFYPVCKDPALPKIKFNSHQIFYHIKHSCQL